MAKVLYLIRHAKSSWQDPSLSDHDRPLNDRGFRDAPFMAKLLPGKGVQADAIVSSTAKRAFTTASYFGNAMGIPVNAIHLRPEVYESYPSAILDMVQRFPADWNTVLLFGHNPTFTDLANRFSDQYIPNVPTCGIVRIEGSVDSWEKFDPGTAQLTEFHFPKQYFPK